MPSPSNVNVQIAQLEEQGAKLHYFLFSDFGVEMMNNGVVANADWVQQNHDAAKAFVRTSLDAFRLSKENPDKAIDLLIKRLPQQAQPKRSATATRVDVPHSRNAQHEGKAAWLHGRARLTCNAGLAVEMWRPFQGCRTDQALHERIARDLSAMPQPIEVSGVSKAFGVGKGRVEALRDIELEVSAGEFVAIVGASGCGKSTLLRPVGSLMAPTNGQVKIGGQVVTEPRLVRVSVLYFRPRFFFHGVRYSRMCSCLWIFNVPVRSQKGSRSC